MATLQELRSRLTDTQVKAAYLLVQNSFANRDEKKTLEEIAHECGISRMELYRWRYNNTDFIKFVEALSDMRLAAYRDMADAQLIKLIQGTSNNGIPSIKALELYYKLSGRLVDRKQIEVDDVANRPRLTAEEVAKGLDELNAMLKDEDE
jgi:transcriptional regulator with XRE-family HTH domain